MTGSLDGDKAGGNGLGAAATAGLEVLDGSDAKAEATAEVGTDQAGEEDQPEETVTEAAAEVATDQDGEEEQPEETVTEAAAEVATDQAGEEDQPEEIAATDDATQGETENLPEAVGGED